MEKVKCWHDKNDLVLQPPVCMTFDKSTLSLCFPICKMKGFDCVYNRFLQALMFCGSVILGLSGQILSCSPRKSQLPLPELILVVLHRDRRGESLVKRPTRVSRQWWPG